MTPKEDCEVLLNALLQFAGNQLTKHGEFYPFGAVMQNGNDISLTAVDTGDDHPGSIEMIHWLTEIHAELAMKGEIKASGICWDAKANFENGVRTDAIMVSLEHRENYSVLVGQPYRMGHFKKLSLSAMFAQKGSNDIFDKKQG